MPSRFHFEPPGTLLELFPVHKFTLHFHKPQQGALEPFVFRSALVQTNTLSALVQTGTLSALIQGGGLSP